MFRGTCSHVSNDKIHDQHDLISCFTTENTALGGVSESERSDYPIARISFSGVERLVVF